MAGLADFFGRVDGYDEVDHPETSRFLDALPDLLDRLQPQALDHDASSVCAEAEMVTISLVHATDTARSLSVVLFGDEAVVSYGEEHEHFRSNHEDGPRQVGPFLTRGMVPKLLSFLEALMADRIELHVWKRPLWIRTRSYWVNEAGERELFLRGGTVLPTLGWSGPTVRRFGYR